MITPTNEEYRSCSECGQDCPPEPFTTDNGIRVAFVCEAHGVHTVIDPFESKR